MGELRINLTNFITVGLMAFIALFIISKGLQAIGKPQWNLAK